MDIQYVVFEWRLNTVVKYSCQNTSCFFLFRLLSDIQTYINVYIGNIHMYIHTYMMNVYSIKIVFAELLRFSICKQID